jgi:hypothetical protein
MKILINRHFVLIFIMSQACNLQARCYGFDPACWAKEAGKGITKAAEETGKGIEYAAEETGKGIVYAAEETGKGIVEAANAIGKVGETIGDATIKEIAKTGEVTLEILGKAGQVVLKVGEATVTSVGMTLLNTGGVIVALTTGDIDSIKECANAVATSNMYGLSTVVDESLKVVGSIDQLIRIDSVSLEASSAELALQGKTPKVSINGSFLKKSFAFKNIQLDLSNPDKLVADLFALLVKIK